MDLTYKQEVTVGALVLVGFLVFTAFMFWLTGRSIVSKAVPVQVEFANVQGLKEGDPVRVSGVKKGRVGPVRLERVGRVSVTLQLDPGVQPHKDATATNGIVLRRHGCRSARSTSPNGPAVQQTHATRKSLERVMAHLDTLSSRAAAAETGKRLDTLSVNLTRLTGRLADATGSLKG